MAVQDKLETAHDKVERVVAAHDAVKLVSALVPLPPQCTTLPNFEKNELADSDITAALPSSFFRSSPPCTLYIQFVVVIITIVVVQFVIMDSILVLPYVL